MFGSLSLLLFVVSAGSFSSLGVVLPAMVRELGWNWTEAGLGYSVLGLACGLASLLPTLMIRGIGVRATLIAGTALLVAGFAALALAHGVRLYLTATLLIGVAFALTSTVPGTHLLTRRFRRHSTVIGAYYTIGALGSAAGPLLYVAIEGATHRWRLYWWAFAAASALSGLFAALVADPAALPGEPAPSSEMQGGSSGWSVRRALATPQFAVIVGAYSVYLLINTVAHGFAVEHLSEVGVAPGRAAGMLSLEALVGALVSLVGGVLGERIDAKTLLVVALGALAASMAALATARGTPLMLAYALCMGIGYGLSFLASTLLLLRFFGQASNLELYSIMCLISTAAAIGPLLVGWARDALGGFGGVFLLCAATALGTMLVSLLLTPPDQPRPAAAAGSRA